VGGSPATFPPAPAARTPGAAALESARQALARGEAGRAFRVLCEAKPERGGDPAWLVTGGLVQAALGRPWYAIGLFSEASARDPRAAALARAAARRLAPGLPVGVLRPAAARWPGLGAEVLKTAVALRPAAGDSLFLLFEGRLQLLGPDGRERASQALPGAVDLTLDPAGLPLALGRGQFFHADRLIPLPATLLSATSIAASPDGRIFVLDEKAGALVVLDGEGKFLDRKPLGLGNPGKVRTDESGHIYIPDGRDRSVAVLRGDLSPDHTVRYETIAPGVRRLDDLLVDPFGSLLLVDGKRGQAALLSPEGRLLAESPREGSSFRAAGWDGLETMLYLDDRAGAVGRVEW